jgi:hypothetical protein
LNGAPAVGKKELLQYCGRSDTARPPTEITKYTLQVHSNLAGDENGEFVID